MERRWRLFRGRLMTIFRGWQKTSYVAQEKISRLKTKIRIRDQLEVGKRNGPNRSKGKKRRAKLFSWNLIEFLHVFCRFSFSWGDRQCASPVSLSCRRCFDSSCSSLNRSIVWRTSSCSSNVLSTDMKTIFLTELWRPTAREENGMSGL
jgi:hypothetical protein